MIKYILIDFDNTLLDFDKASSEILKSVFEDNGFIYNKEMHAKFLEVNDDFWNAHEEGKITVEYIRQNRFKVFFEKIGVKINNNVDVEQIFRNGVSKSLIKIDGADEILRYLSDKYQVYIVSNGVAFTQYNRIEKTGWNKYFSGIFLSEEVGFQKPFKEFFNYCFEKIGSFDKEDYIIIGDSINSDIQGGNNVGIKTCLFNKKQISEFPKETNFNYKVNNLLEIKNIL
ncbi:MAG: YjjG family noncanonical pyrimidine nucleotidase [Clostridia bacterium]